MKDKIVTIWHGETFLLLSKDFAKLMGINDGDRIDTHTEFLEILGLHCKHQIAKLKLLTSANEKAQ